MNDTKGQLLSIIKSNGHCQEIPACSSCAISRWKLSRDRICYGTGMLSNKRYEIAVTTYLNLYDKDTDLLEILI